MKWDYVQEHCLLHKSQRLQALLPYTRITRAPAASYNCITPPHRRKSIRDVAAPNGMQRYAALQLQHSGLNV